MAALACRRSWITVIPTPAACFRRTFASASTRKSYDPPESPTFYTGRARYYDYLANLERAIHHTRQTLKTFQLDPLPEFARKSLPLASSAWLNKDDMANSLSSKLSSTRHRRLLELLDTLNNFRRIATAAGHENLAQNISTVLEIFERKDKLTVTSRTRKTAEPDAQGRTYTTGARKTSSARVWMISSEHATAAKERNGLPAAPVTEILVNKVPLNEYFRIPADRERILRPFRVAGLLGAYNVFALVRGGGLSGQSGAIANGVAKGLAAHVPDIELILRRGKLLATFVIAFLTLSPCSETDAARPTYGRTEEDWLG